MLREISFPQLVEWIAYDQLEPFGDRRGDWQVATICAVLANIAGAFGRTKKRFAIKDFLLQFEGSKQTSNRQSVQEQKMIAQMIAAAFTPKDPHA